MTNNAQISQTDNLEKSNQHKWNPQAEDSFYPKIVIEWEPKAISLHNFLSKK